MSNATRPSTGGGWWALADRPQVPQTPAGTALDNGRSRYLAARDQAKAGPRIVAGLLGRPASSVWKVLKRNGAARLRLSAREPVCRYERARGSCSTSIRSG